jgi:glutamyl-tRNA(Gln) amidotransferase subunit E
MRPLPGGARMYPETDVPVFILSPERWQETLQSLPMTDNERSERISKYEVSNDQASQLLARELDDIFVEYASQLPHKGWASVLLENDTADPELCANIMAVKEAGLITRESINEIIEHFKGMTPNSEQIAEYGEANGFKPADEGDLGAIIEGIVAERADFVKERGMGAMGPLMGAVMQAVGAADGKVVSALLRQAIQKILE